MAVPAIVDLSSLLRSRGDVLVLTCTPMGTTKPRPTFAIAPDYAVHEKPMVKRRKFELDPEAFRSGGRRRHED